MSWRSGHQRCQLYNYVDRRRGLGEIGHGNGRRVLLHPKLAEDAANGNCLGLLSGQVWTRKERRTASHDRRDLSETECRRWIDTALAAKPLLARAAMVIEPVIARAISSPQPTPPSSTSM